MAGSEACIILAAKAAVSSSSTRSLNVQHLKFLKLQIFVHRDSLDIIFTAYSAHQTMYLSNLQVVQVRAEF